MARPRKPPLGRVRDAALTRVEYARRAGRGRSDRKVVAVVGMHRSGTSAVAGTLQEAGLYLGDVSRKHDANRKGTREHVAIMQLHESILAHSGGSWREPPARIEWTDEHRSRRDTIIRSFAGAELWGFKDPRAVLMLDFWREALHGSLELVGVFREPGAVVSSLLRRDSGSVDEWLALWARHNEELLREMAEGRFPLVEVVQDPEAFRRQLIPVLERLDLRVPARLGFFDSTLLESSDPRTMNIPGDVRTLFERLQVVARGGARSR